LLVSAQRQNCSNNLYLYILTLLSPFLLTYFWPHRLPHLHTQSQKCLFACVILFLAVDCQPTIMSELRVGWLKSLYIDPLCPWKLTNFRLLRDLYKLADRSLSKKDHLKNYVWSIYRNRSGKRLEAYFWDSENINYRRIPECEAYSWKNCEIIKSTRLIMGAAILCRKTMS